MTKLPIFILVLGVFFCSPSFAAGGAQTDSAPRRLLPVKALVAPTQATVFCEAKVAVEREGGRARLRFLLPESASKMRVSVPGQTVAASFESPALDGTGVLSRKDRLDIDIAACKGEIAAIEAKEAGLLKHARESGGNLDAANMKKLAVSRKEAEIKMARIKELSEALPDSSGLYRCMEVVLDGDVREKELAVSCIYIDAGCGWTPTYRVNCLPGSGKGGVDVVFEALVSQNSGFDWNGVDVTLATSSSGGVGIPSLGTWLVGKEKKGPFLGASGRAAAKNPAKVADMEDAAPVGLMAAAPAMSNAAPSTRPVEADLSGDHVTWHSGTLSLKSGLTRITLARAFWKEPLCWIARPKNADAKVYLYVDHKLGAGEMWPAGQASLSLDGVPVGETTFKAREGKIRLSFGDDPRMSVASRPVPTTSSTSGVISQKNVWEWAWEYSVRNGRDSEALVRLERPLPRVVNKDFKVEMKNEPEAAVEKDALVWECRVPAGESSFVLHEVKVVAPEGATFQQVRP